MIKLNWRCVVTVIAWLALQGCQTTSDTASSTDVYNTMVKKIDPAAVMIWSIGSRAMSEASGSRHTRMDDGSWRSLQSAASQIAFHANLLSNASTIRVGPHSDKLEGFASGAEIQARIDADPNGFRRLAQEMRLHAEKIEDAAYEKDIPASQQLIKNLYDNCRACHSRYWETHSP